MPGLQGTSTLSEDKERESGGRDWKEDSDHDAKRINKRKNLKVSDQTSFLKLCF